MKVLLLEDEYLVAVNICSQLEQLGFEVVGRTDNASDAIVLAATVQPDIALLDIHVKGEMNGVDAGGVIAEKFNIPVVYLSSDESDELFNSAKETRPQAFLNKPVLPVTLKRSLELALQPVTLSDAKHPQAKELQVLNGFVFLKIGTNKVKLSLDQIYIIKASGSYCNLYLKDSTHLFTKPLGTMLHELQELSGGDRFVQISRSCAVNIEHVEQLKGNMVVVLGESLDITQSFRDKVLRLFPQL